MLKVLFVCLGNICRSPAAEGVFRNLCQKQGTASRFVIDSAGTAAYHVGASPDARMQAAARSRGVELGGLRGRQTVVDDFHKFDIIIAMDASNMANLQGLKPATSTAQLVMMLDYGHSTLQEVPDPYYGGADGFEQVLDLLEDACLDFHRQFVSH